MHRGEEDLSAARLPCTHTYARNCAGPFTCPLQDLAHRLTSASGQAVRLFEE
jgi:hypothetical protein